ncbi:MAG: chromosome segregation protein SMC [Geobacteraceae bacterium]|nr:chromosome segregation protein SMC [Geobacteraceae bacterium]
MIISRLEIHGFKSFADRVSLTFDKGITGIVGPNGCGKSNIVDAIRWVMGEQSAKTLRGKSMEDTIFGGSETRKPLGMTEVSLAFSTEDGRIPAKYLNFSEIQVTRRLFRDGESEYLLNGTPCRLMDIAELFMDTGAGAKAYSIIEQGKIGMILSSRPEERRLIIEEAAGVTKFKARKQVALKKIEATRQNLSRIGDILAEIRRQMNTLQRQAKKAEKFREYREELKEIEQLFLVRSYLSLDRERRRIEEELAQLRERHGDALRELESHTLALEERKTGLLEEEKGLNGIQEDIFRIRSAITVLENRNGFERNGLASLEDRLERFSRELAVDGMRAAEAEEELLRLEEQADTLLRELAVEEEGRAEAEECLEQLVEEERILARSLEGHRRELFGIVSEISRFSNQYAAAAKRLASLGEQTERSQREAVVLQEKLHEATERVRDLESSFARLTESRAKAESVLAELREREAGLRAALDAAERSFHGERDRLSKASSRLHSLQELEAQFEGYGRGVRTLFRSDTFSGRLKGVVADILEVDEEFEIALEAALSDRLQYIICEGEADARAAVSFLRHGSGGRCSLIPRDLPSAHVPPERPDGAVPLLDRVAVPGEYRALAETLLDRVFLVDTLDIAFDLGARFPGMSFVTRDGDMVTAGGILHGGSMEGAQHGLIHKKRRIKELSLEVAALTARVAELDAEREQLRAEVRTTEDSLRMRRQELHRLEIQLVNDEKDLQRAREECQRLGERIAVRELEDEQLRGERESLEREMEAAFRERSAREAGKEKAEDELARLQASLEAGRQRIAEARESVTARKVRSASLREKRESSLTAATRVAEGIRELGARRSHLESELENGSRERDRIRESLAAGEQELRRLLCEQQRLEEEVAAIRSRYEAQAALVDEGERQVKELRSAAENLSRQVGEKNLGMAETVMRLQNLEETVVDKYRVSISDLIPRFAGRDDDEGKTRDRQAELAGLIEGIGEVNLTAIEEFREIESRFEFLSGQKTDLEESLHGLQQAIQRINRTTRKRFLDTFLQVNEKFQEVFPRLFCGGRAELRLTNEQDLLETGIDIVIQPPGKRLQNVNLLSGGEKALTAVALMFAIFLIKPAPFCLLDEVDAPLDEANIGRFNEMVREMSSFSQFIIITHNKATMTNTDVLYGVTMEEPGVSKLVSVKLS